MNPIVNINLGGLPFAVDADAYERLNHYLDRIHAHFRTSEGYEEITDDIEARLAELFRENNRPIVNDRDVQNAIEVMGTPEEFGAEDVYTEPTGATDRNWNTGKRLFRDPEHAALGGVAAGLSAYLGIENPVWVRVVFVLLTLGGGLSVVIYPLLWIILPPARNASERLAMRGEKIDINSIGSTIEADLRRLGNRMNEQFGDAERMERWGNRFGEQVEGAVYGVVGGLRRLFRPRSVLGALARILVALCLVAAALFWIAVVLSVTLGGGLLDYVYAGQPLGKVFGTLGVLLVGSVPLLVFSLLLMALTRNVRFRPVWMAAPLAAFILGGLLLGISVGNLVNDFKTEGEVSERRPLTLTPAAPLQLRVDAERTYRTGEWDFGDFELGPHELAMKDLSFSVRRSPDAEARLVVERVSQGRNLARAEALAARIDYPIDVADNTVSLPDWFALPEGTPLRGQRVRIRLEVPDGTELRFDDRLQRFTRRHRSDLAPALRDAWKGHRLPGGTELRMTESGLTYVDSTRLSVAD